MHLLHDAIPMLANYSALLERTIPEGFYDVWKNYCGLVSDISMAVSWETACFLIALCESLNVKNILDLGSGFSTIAITSWGKGKEVCITSVDHERHWLIKTRNALRSMGLSTNGLTCLQPCEINMLPGDYDLVFYDYGNVPTRAKMFDAIKALVGDGGVLIMDDMHMLGLGHLFWTDLSAPDSGFTFYSAREYTLDHQYRFADLARRRHGNI